MVLGGHFLVDSADMRRLALIALASSLSIPVIVLVHGCEPRAPSIQDFCGFLANEDNCYLTLL